VPADRGRRRLSEDLVTAIEGLALTRPVPTTAFTHRRIVDLARDRGLPEPSYSTVRGIITAIDPGLRTLALGGDAAYRDQFEIVYRRTATRPNEQWQADHTLLDVQAVDERGRPALVVIHRHGLDPISPGGGLAPLIDLLEPLPERLLTVPDRCRRLLVLGKLEEPDDH